MVAFTLSDVGAGAAGVTGDLATLLAEAEIVDRVDAGAFRFRFDRTSGADETLAEDITGSAE